jgi:hypothetical protein
MSVDGHHRHQPEEIFMRAVVVYESMSGNAHQIATEIGDGIIEVMPVTVTSVTDATASVLTGVDVIVAGAPTHMQRMVGTLEEVQKRATDSVRDLHLHDHTAEIGVREWLEALPTTHAMAAAFDTRTDIPGTASHAAAGRIDHALRGRGLRVVSAPMSFLADSSNHLESSELARARAWGIDIAHDAMSRHAADTNAERR